MSISVADAKAWVRKTGFDTRLWIERLARLGYAAKGVVYVVIGVIALRAGIGQGGDPEGSSGALESIASQPLGRFMIAAVAVGLFGYALWRAVQALLDPEGDGGDAKGNLKRAGMGLSAVIHGALAVEGARLAMGVGTGGDDEASVDQRTAMLMEQPLGRWLVGAVGVGVLAFAVYQLYRAYEKKLSDRLRLGELDPDTRRWAVRAGRVGYAARGVVFAISGYFLVQAALNYNPSAARGLGEALQTLRGQSYGPWVLSVVAIGLIGYGFFAFVTSAYRRIQPP
jgi:Domain of Unknown Function (DUF1206)